MNTFALFTAIAAVAAFVLYTFKETREAWELGLGLALFASAFIVQLVFNSGPFVTH